jgi:hypothetical protein
VANSAGDYDARRLLRAETKRAIRARKRRDQVLDGGWGRAAMKAAWDAQWPGFFDGLERMRHAALALGLAVTRMADQLREAGPRVRASLQALSAMPALCVNCAGQGWYWAPPAGWKGNSVEAFCSGSSVKTTCSECGGSGSAPKLSASTRHVHGVPLEAVVDAAPLLAGDPAEFDQALCTCSTTPRPPCGYCEGGWRQ